MFVCNPNCFAIEITALSPTSMPARMATMFRDCAKPVRIVIGPSNLPS